MPFYDHDLHIHSYISPCASDEERAKQTVDRILQYAKENSLHTICVADHFWDEDVPAPFPPQYTDLYSFQTISSIRPLPQKENIRFLFGCETEIHHDGRISISEERIKEFDFIIVPTTHFHNGYALSPEEAAAGSKGRATAWVKRFEDLLNSNLPFHKVGVAHLTTALVAPYMEMLKEVFSLIPEKEMERLFKRSAELGLGIELNTDGMGYDEDQAELLFRPYEIAKECGCKFYCGSDAHRPFILDRAKKILEKGIERLNLTDKDKFNIYGLGARK